MTRPASARTAALEALRTIERGSTLGDALARWRRTLTDRRDRALTTELVTGVLRWRAALDHQIEQRSSKPLTRLDAGVLAVLRLGAYQLLHLERVPVSAVVNDSVELVRALGLSSAAGFVNAVLRRLARERDALTWPSVDNLASYLATVHSHPRWLVERWLERFGAATTEQWLRFNNAVPDLTLATNRLLGSRAVLADRLEAEGVRTSPTPLAPHGLIVLEGRALEGETFRDGYCLVQDEASQLVAETVQSGAGDLILDVCASPGGKTIAAAGQAGGRVRVVATDVRGARVALLAQTLERCRATNVHPLQVSPTGALPFRTETFDRVLVDAPCSGLGTVRRDPDLRWRRQPADFPALAEAQRALLGRVSPLVKRGGRLIYSTCSSEPEENQDVVEAFLAERPDFVLVPLADSGVDTRIVSRLAPLHGASNPFLATHPAVGLEAFFAATLEKQ